MRILVLGADGYLGWPTAMYFAARGHDVMAFDNLAKRKWVLEVGVVPLIPIETLHRRCRVFEEVTGKQIQLRVGDLTNHRAIYKAFEEFDPEVVVHYAEQPSAPYSMLDRETAFETQRNNVLGTLNLLFAIQRYNPGCHLIKLGTMGEYGTPNIDIEEGYLEIEHKGRRDVVPFPKQGGSFYHLSKVHDSNNIMFAVKTWGLRATDLNQGPVYGIETEETRLHPSLATSFHYDEVFGTVLNRYCVQAVCGHSLTPYGIGKQRRGFINILDTLRCVELATLHPAEPGRTRVLNQFTEVFSVTELAEMVQRCGRELGLDPEVRPCENPRIEQEDHYYNPVHTKLQELGLEPHLLGDALIESMLRLVLEHRDHIRPEQIVMGVRWKSK